MQRLFQFVFLAFYFASSLSITQEHVLSAAWGMWKSVLEHEAHFDAAGSRQTGATIRFSEYRHPKLKGGVDFIVGRRKSHDVPSGVPKEALRPLTDSVESLLILEGILSRAPPVPNQPVQ